MKEAFKTQRFNVLSSLQIERANEIIKEYQEKGYVLTLRQLYYQFVAREYIANNMRSYKSLGETINNGRLAGLIDWSAIEDRTRSLLSIPHYDSPVDFLEQTVPNYAEPLWEDQPYYCEVWIEKEALAGVVERACTRLRVPFFSCRGYGSQSEVYAAGKRLARYRRQGKKIVIFHLGDHDPSGLDMSRDNLDRLNMFAGGGVDLRRLGLNYDQIVALDPPPNPTKVTDSRAAKYMEIYGDDCWELDALEPEYIDNLIGTNIESLIDKDLMRDAADLERANRADLNLITQQYHGAFNAARLIDARIKLDPNQD